MKKFILGFGILFILPIFSFAWVTPTGSTESVVNADYDIKDIVNASWDRVNNCFAVKVSSSVSSFPTDYPDITAQSSLSSIDTNTGNIYSELNSTPSVSDIRYTSKISTGTAGKVLVSGNIAITNYSMETYAFYSVGGDTEITSTWTNGIIYALDGIPVNTEKLSIPVINPTFQCSLNYGTTLYYILQGVK